jgi:hypothetical protein
MVLAMHLWRGMRLLMFAPLLAACATSPIVMATPPPAAAADPTARPAAYACGDTVLNDQATSGGEPLTLAMPCWDYQDEAEHAVAPPVVAQASAIQRRTAADSEIQAIKGLAESEIAACAHIPQREREHSPFSHRRSIAEVMPLFEAGKLRGAKVVFKPVPGLSADWLREDIACHQAHVAVLGSVPDAMAQDPTLVQNAEVTVIDEGDHLMVVVHTDSPDQAAVALAKAQGKGPVGSIAEETAPAVK